MMPGEGDGGRRVGAGWRLLRPPRPRFFGRGRRHRPDDLGGVLQLGERPRPERSGRKLRFVLLLELVHAVVHLEARAHFLLHVVFSSVCLRHESRRHCGDEESLAESVGVILSKS